MRTPPTPPTPPAPATVAGRALSEWSRDGRLGTWYALGPAGADEPPLGVLRIHRALLAPSGAGERLTAAVRSVAKLRLPGVPATVDLLREAGDVWLVVARPPARTVSDLLATGAPGLDEGSAASVLNETAQTLLALHAAGLAHGSLTPGHVVLAPDGTALLIEASLGTALAEDDASAASPQEADIAAWAALARTLGTAWAAPGTPAAELFARCATTAGADGLAAARTTLTSARAALPRDFLRRTALRTAAAAALAELTEPATESPEPSEATASAEDTAAHAPAGVAPDERDTMLGKRHRSIPATPLTPVPGGGEDDGEIVLRFGPGVPRSEEEALRALWAAPAPAPTPPRRRRWRRAGLLGATAALAAVAVVLWLLLRPTTGPVVTAVRVTAPAQELACGGTADVTGVVTTDGHAGPFRYRWLRSDGQRSEVLTRTARGGEHEVALHLRWTVRGPGRFHGTAHLQVLRPDTPPLEAEAAFTYACAG
ncbi:hypothetical protein ACIGN6_36390 [Streptomyces sp. NPDC053792]|uniref:hypothetical protein n=1 Tax=Streptomyces sp. NPDC053792 TaxID=3365716 RepID=UPI0037CDB811